MIGGNADAVTVEPVACAVHAVLGAPITDGDVVAIIGAGTVGLLVTAALNHLADAGRCDVVTDLARPYPVPIICALLGAPREDWQQKVESVGLTFHTLENGTPYWDESAAYHFSAAEIDIRPAARQMLGDIGHPFAKGEPVYGINTGFGKLASVRIMARRRSRRASAPAAHAR